MRTRSEHPVYRCFVFIQVVASLCSPVLCGACKDQPKRVFNFCPVCGKRVHECGESSGEAEVQFDFRGINERIAYLDRLLGGKSYSKQKCALSNELKVFMSKLCPPKSLDSVNPEDLRMFLVSKECKGRTKLHSKDCVHMGVQGQNKCDCPFTLTIKTVDSLIGKLRAILNEHGRSGEWNPISGTGNPAASPVLKKHLQCVTLEQTSASVVPKQAVPMLFDKLARLCRYLNYKAFREREPVSKFLYARDCAYFSVLSHTGGRGGDMGLITANRLFQLPDDKGLVISQIEGKTVKIDNPNNIVLFRSKDPDICPVRCLRIYLDTAQKVGVNLKEDFLFRSRDIKSKEISEKAVTSSGMTDRLRGHLEAINLYAGETAHSSRRGLAITLRMLGVDDNSISNHIGWRSESMLATYDRIGSLVGPHAAASKLANAAEMIGEASQLTRISEKTIALSSLKRFHFQ